MRRDRIHRHLRGMPPSKVLEVGCGAGALSTELAGQGHEMTALESSSLARELAGRLARAADVRVDFREAPSAEWANRFDIVMAFEVLEHIEDDNAAFRDWASWVRPGGLLLLSVPAHQAKWTAGDEWAGHFRRYEREDLERLFGSASLQILNLETWGFPLANLLQPASAVIYRRRIASRAAQTSKAAATAVSGVDRGLQVKLHDLYINPLGSLFFRAMYGMQQLAADSELGVGYLVLARKAE